MEFYDCLFQQAPLALLTSIFRSTTETFRSKQIVTGIFGNIKLRKQVRVAEGRLICRKRQ